MSSNRDRRIDRLLPTLSAQERAVFLLRQYKAGAPPSALILGTMPGNQVAALNGYIRLMNTVNADLGAALLLLSAQVKQTDIKYGWLMSLVLLGGEIEDAGYWMLRDTKDTKLRRHIKQLIAKAPGALADLTAQTACRESIASRLVRELIIAIRDGLNSHWRELRAIELVVEEVAEEFAGEDPLREDTRRVLDDAKMKCVELSECIARHVDGFELGEPSNQDVELVRKFVMAHGNES